MKALLVVAGLVGVARADEARIVDAIVHAKAPPAGTALPKLYITHTAVTRAPEKFNIVESPSTSTTMNPADGPHWRATDVQWSTNHVGHCLFVFDRGQPVVWMISQAVSDELQAKMGNRPEALVGDVPVADGNAYMALVAMLRDPKTMAGSVAPGALLYGSAPGERFVGRDAVAAQWKRWNLDLDDANQRIEGLTADGELAWFVLTVDARPHGKPKAKPVPYRALILLSKQSGTWALAAATFGVDIH